jgi:hypothetical protein
VQAAESECSVKYERHKISSSTPAAPDARASARRQRWAWFGSKGRRVGLGEDRFQRIEPRCEREAVVVDRAAQMAGERGGFIVG